MSENNVDNIWRFHNQSFPVIKLLICQIDIDEAIISNFITFVLVSHINMTEKFQSKSGQ